MLSFSNVGFLLFPITSLFTDVCLSVCPSVRVPSITKHCLLSPALKAREEEEVGQELMLRFPNSYLFPRPVKVHV